MTNLIPLLGFALREQGQGWKVSADGGGGTGESEKEIGKILLGVVETTGKAEARKKRKEVLFDMRKLNDDFGSVRPRSILRQGARTI